MAEDRPDDLRRAILDLHGSDSEWIEAVSLEETFEGQPVWQGTVQVFRLLNHPTAKRAYAWPYATPGSDKSRFVAVLHQGSVDSPRAAVQAAIIQESTEKP